MSEFREYSTLEEALAGEGIEKANWDVIRAAVDAIGIESYWSRRRKGERDGRGIRAVRRREGPDLRIEYGHTIGFTSEAEAHRAAPNLPTWANNDTASRWGISHPVNAHRDPSSSRREEPLFESCRTCFLEKTSGGTCGCN